jgi:hypothetical protein
MCAVVPPFALGAVLPPIDSAPAAAGWLPPDTSAKLVACDADVIHAEFLRVDVREAVGGDAGVLIAREVALDVQQEHEEKKDKEREDEDVEHAFLPQRSGVGSDGRIVFGKVTRR